MDGQRDRHVKLDNVGKEGGLTVTRATNMTSLYGNGNTEYSIIKPYHSSKRNRMIT